MKNRIKPPALDDRMPKEEMTERVAEMLAADSDMDPIDETFLKNHRQDDISRMAG